MAEKALGLVVRGIDWSESSRIVTLWTRELGKVRALAKGGRRLHSNFESALDLLSLCSIVLLRKSSGSLDLLTEARVAERFPHLRHDLEALNAAYYVAELLGDWTEDYDPHPNLFDETLAALRAFGTAPTPTGVRLARFELVFLHELGYRPVLQQCAQCAGLLPEQGLYFSVAVGGLLCRHCQTGQREGRPVSVAAGRALLLLSEAGDDWQNVRDRGVRTELRQLLNHYVTYLRGRRPRLQPYLGS